MQEKRTRRALALLVIIQVMDAGKDSVNPRDVGAQGRQASSFKAPLGRRSRARLSANDAAPSRAGQIGVFNRSYYEEVPVVRVHPEPWPPNGCRPRSSVAFWKSGSRTSTPSNGICIAVVLVRKFFLHVSKKKQRSGSSSDRAAGEELEVFHARRRSAPAGVSIGRRMRR
jgi:polyphosphate kinase 2 (PPK2 family)